MKVFHLRVSVMSLLAAVRLMGETMTRADSQVNQSGKIVAGGLAFAKAPLRC